MKPCGAALCPAIVRDGVDFCLCHQGAKQITHVMVGQRCARCRRLLSAGEFVTRDSTLERTEHALCPPRRPVTRKVDRNKPLWDGSANRADSAQTPDAARGKG